MKKTKKLFLVALSCFCCLMLFACNFFDEETILRFSVLPEEIYLLEYDDPTNTENCLELQKSVKNIVMEQVRVEVVGDDVYSLKDLEEHGAIIAGLDFGMAGEHNLVVSFNNTIISYGFTVRNNEGIYLVENVDKGIPYPSLKLALAACENGQTLRLLEDIYCAFEDAKHYIINSDDELTLDLNGHKIVGVCGSNSSAPTNLGLIVNYGTLTIKDSSDLSRDGSGSGLLSLLNTNPNFDPTPGTGDYTIKNHGVLTIESGVIENRSYGTASFAIDSEQTLWDINGDNRCKETVILNITGGWIRSTVAKAGGSWAHTIRVYATTTDRFNICNISGGKLSNTYKSTIYLHMSGATSKNLTLNITGGIFETGNNDGARNVFEFDMRDYDGENGMKTDYEFYNLKDDSVTLSDLNACVFHYEVSGGTFIRNGEILSCFEKGLKIAQAL